MSEKNNLNPLVLIIGNLVAPIPIIHRINVLMMAKTTGAGNSGKA